MLLWISSPEAATATAYSLSAGGNFTLIRAAMNWMTGNTYASVSVPSVLMSSGTLALDTNGTTLLGVVLIMALPLAFLIPSAVYLYKRKKR